MRIPLWIRHVVVPKLTDGRDQILKIAFMARQYSNLQKLELLPFRKICISKYEQMNIPFPLRDYDACPEEKIQILYKLIEESR